MKLTNVIRRIKRKLSETCWKYMVSGSKVRVVKGGKLFIGRNVRIINCSIYIDSQSSMQLKDNVRLECVDIFIKNGKIIIGEYSYLEKVANPVRPNYMINTGQLIVSDHVQLQCQRLWIRFGANISIDSYTNINHGTELRSDERVEIGKYCRISYNIRIWDTNTHCIYSPGKRAQITRKYFPSFGFEDEKPETSAVKIGDGCWIGEKVSILKGSNIGNDVTIGYNTLVIGKTIPDGKKVLQEVRLKVL